MATTKRSHERIAVADTQNIRPIYEDVPVGDILIDPMYQRPFNALWARRLAENFDPLKFGTLALSLREDLRYYAIAGQHRVAAALKAVGPEWKAPSRVYVGLTPEQEAAMYTAYDAERRLQSTPELWRADTAAGKQVVTNINRLLAQYGLEPNLERGRGQANGKVIALASLRNLYESGGESLLNDVLWVLCSRWGTSHTAYTRPFLDGFGHFLRRHRQDINLARLVERLHDYVTPDALLQSAIMRARSNMRAQVSIAHGMSMELVDCYNRYRKTAARLPAWTSAVTLGSRAMPVDLPNAKRYVLRAARKAKGGVVGGA